MLDAATHKEFFGGHELQSVCVRDRNTFYFALKKLKYGRNGEPAAMQPARPDIRIIRLVLNNGTPELKKTNLTNYSGDFNFGMLYPDEQIALITTTGDFFKGKGGTQPDIEWARNGGPLNGLIEGISVIDRASTVLCTLGRDLLTVADDGTVKRLGPPPDKDYSIYEGFCGLDGFALDDIYAVTQDDGIHHFDGQSWRKVKCKNRTANAVCCTDSGFAYVAGAYGEIYRGRGDSWERIFEDKNILYGFKELAWHEDLLWCVDDLRCHAFSKDGKEAYGVTRDACPGHLSARDGVLLTGGLGEKISWRDRSGTWHYLFSET